MSKFICRRGRKIKKVLLHQVGSFLGLVIVVSVSSIFGAILLRQVIAAPAGTGSDLTKIGSSGDTASMGTTLFAGQQKIYDNLGSDNSGYCFMSFGSCPGDATNEGQVGSWSACYIRFEAGKSQSGTGFTVFSDSCPGSMTRKTGGTIKACCKN